MANRIMLTRSLAYASGQDAGNASMRKGGRTKWNRDDYNAACEVTNRLLAHLPIPTLGDLVAAGIIKPAKRRMVRLNKKAL